MQNFKLATRKYKTIEMFRPLFLKSWSMGYLVINVRKNLCTGEYEKFKYLFLLQYLENV